MTAVADEEFASIGTASALQRWRADAAIVTEPTELDICIAHKGFAWLDIETRGVAAHGSRPDLGVDAVAKMGKVLVGLEELDRSLRANRSHPLLGSGSLHASLISGGKELSTYPDRCVLKVERRTIPGETRERVEREIQSILDAIAAGDANFQAALNTTFAREPFEVAQDEPIVQLVYKHARAILQRQPTFTSSAAWMDAALLTAAGIPTVIFGPGGEGAHALVEWVDLDQVQQCADVLSAVIGFWRTDL